MKLRFLRTIPIPNKSDLESANQELLDEVTYVAADDLSTIHINPTGRTETLAANFYGPGVIESVELDDDGQLLVSSLRWNCLSPFHFCMKKGDPQTAGVVQGYDAQKLMFVLTAPEEQDLADDEKKEVVQGPLEQELVQSDLPYISIPLFVVRGRDCLN